MVHHSLPLSRDTWPLSRKGLQASFGSVLALSLARQWSLSAWRQGTFLANTPEGLPPLLRSRALSHGIAPCQPTTPTEVRALALSLAQQPVDVRGLARGHRSPVLSHDSWPRSGEGAPSCLGPSARSVTSTHVVSVSPGALHLPSQVLRRHRRDLLMLKTTAAGPRRQPKASCSR